jgi:hypothetical protein
VPDVVPDPAVTPTPTPIPDILFDKPARACAGGVAVDGVHSFTLVTTAKRPDGSVATNATLNLSFENNRGHVKRATFIPDESTGQTLIQGSNGERMRVSTDSYGRFRLTVLSSFM